MLGNDPLLPKFREGRSWGCEVRYGPKGYLETISQQEGFRETPLLEPQRKIGNLYLSAEKRFAVEPGLRLVISSWASCPFILEDLSFSDVKRRAKRLHTVLRRMIHAKARRFFKELRNGKAAGVKV